ncbi:MAG: polyphosphate polymerase domain-containing protein [Bacteriovoracaceae bacterium]
MAVRYESKYLLNFDQYYALRRQVGFLLKPDTYTTKCGGAYPITSLYFDTPDKEYFYQKINGELRHYKLRFRTYSKSFSLEKDEIWLEQKIKIDDRQFKSRNPLKVGTDIFDKDFLKNFDDADVSREFRTQKLRPSCFVYYEREAYEKYLDSKKLRVTFDHVLSSYPLGQKFEQRREFFEEPQRRRILMEIKYEEQFLPDFLKEILKSYSIKRDYFSKYAMGLTKLENLI